MQIAVMIDAIIGLVDSAAPIILTVNVGALLVIAHVGYRIVRHMARIEIKVDTMWAAFMDRVHAIEEQRYVE